ncbi:DUF3365 domain-containing protein [Psychrobium sp. 1_MG-2023]|uniref:Tll0287-like domain-containing protein n=1 Tax=Psychrobium sp. 1_MG-2023 TaxID=3062624 RepID=UPI0026989F80|nr:DUF3365 domain-containing protein [Psychrobium sp. 1_MG-2023]MDP2562128.1 DUF3365 domain-containing protein [Psychrobium sp. 1_MG-2023]
MKFKKIFSTAKLSKRGLAIVSTVAVGLTTAQPVVANEKTITLSKQEFEQRVQASRLLVKEFAGNLQGTLKPALKGQGPVAAINVCNEVAPKLAQQFEQQTGWRVGRTSLKARNPDNAPDAWESAVLNKLEQKKAQNVAFSQLEYAEVVNFNGQPTLRYIKAIPTAQKPCLACHGSNIKPHVAAKIKMLYPQDKATGYHEGDIRGAFTISQPLSSDWFKRNLASE